MKSSLSTFGLALLCSVVAAQPAQTVTQIITITGRSQPPLAIGGFGDQSLQRSPFSAAIVSAEQLGELGSASALARTNASLSEAYNAEGYWAAFSARGYGLDQRLNYRRDGLPIDAQTAIALANKERIELLLGLSGQQAGSSAPGGLVNYVVKRPTRTPLRELQFQAQSAGSFSAGLDWSERFGADGKGGVRLNAQAGRIDPRIEAARGERQLLALAAEWQLGAGGLLEAEVEWSRQRQPSVPGLSLLGDVLPRAPRIDPRINLNRQPWTQAVDFSGSTGSLRWQRALPGGGPFEQQRLQAHLATQRLRTDDRVAFPFGCYDDGTGTYHADRYCPDGRFDLYDYRSDNERRRVDALEVQWRATLRAGAMRHQIAVGAQQSRRQDRLPPQAFNYAGQGSIESQLIVPPAPDLFGDVVQREQRSSEIFIRDQVEIGKRLGLWAGLRHTRMKADFDQRFTTPWLAITWHIDAATMLYASAGQGVESEAAPNLPRYTNAGALLPALKSRQAEVGFKHAAEHFEAAVTLFDTRRPVAGDFGACDVDASCTRRIDGDARHRGIEASAQWRAGRWSAGGSALWLGAERSGSAQSGINGLEPVNVPRRSLRAQLTHQFSGTALNPAVGAALVHEGPRQVLADNSQRAPGWTRIDLFAHLSLNLAGRPAGLRLSIDNATDARAWRETPTQFGHVYLFPLAPRTLSVSLTTGL